MSDIHLDARREAEPLQRPGYDALWGWFGLSYARWLTMPRVMMHAMPDHWQRRMAQLCKEWDATWNTNDQHTPTVLARSAKGKLATWPLWLMDYRRPNLNEIEAHREKDAPDIDPELEKDRVIEGLRKLARHRKDCASLKGWPPLKCDCELDDILSSLAPTGTR